MKGQNSMPYVFDLHSDIVTDIAVRRAKGEQRVFARRHYPRLMRAGVRAMIAVLWVEPQYRSVGPSRFLQLLGSLMADLGECREEAELVRTAEGLTGAVDAGKVGIFLGVEGLSFVEQWPLLEMREETADTLVAGGVGKENPGPAEDFQGEEPGLEEKLRQALGVLGPMGLRHAILTWGTSNRIAGAAGDPGSGAGMSGLTAFGRHTVRTLQSQGVVLDVSHLDDTSIDGVLDVADGPVIASHSNARALCDVPRNLLDRHIREIGARGGVIGLNAYPKFVDLDHPTMDRFIDHILYMADLIGIDHIAFGFDFMDYLTDEDFQVPENAELRSVEDVPRLLERMSERGLTDAEIEKVAFANASRMMSHVLR
ncbi:dipeptidase [Kyrpidia tusciae]|nr:membrane dipeptidase [Kyrpidia tusciae]